MPGFRIGIDGGSTFCKTVLLAPDDTLLDRRIDKTGWQPAATAEQLLAETLACAGLCRNQVCVTTTGYGREAMRFADGSLTEITAHARGACFLAPGVEGVVDIGGQDSKVIRLLGATVQEFMMNDKCAAGTGRFVEMALRTLMIEHSEADALCDFDNPASINSMCAVFAESEIIGLIAAGVHRGRILGGVMASISVRIAQMLTRVGMPPKAGLLMTGGLSSYRGLADEIGRASGRAVMTHSESIYAGAIGAALSGRQPQ